MRCPFCRHRGNRVVDSRMSGNGATIRRRRVCSGCERRFTTYERVEETPTMVVKKDNRREPYDRNKIVAGLTKACEKRPVSTETIAEISDRIEAAVAERGASEVPSTFIGAAVMNELHQIDQVAYVRFASVYRSFKDIEEFMHELEELIEHRKREPAETTPPPEKKRPATRSVAEPDERARGPRIQDDSPRTQKPGTTE
ncbi:MAG TPA: transcriptional regulator NrdR [Candidatus Binataceae bacterium]|nr:transcriptional regulator NrdR [Candidatus Binataceae bacterium]